MIKRWSSGYTHTHLYLSTYPLSSQNIDIHDHDHITILSFHCLSFLVIYSLFWGLIFTSLHSSSSHMIRTIRSDNPIITSHHHSLFPLFLFTLSSTNLSPSSTNISGLTTLSSFLSKTKSCAEIESSGYP